MWDKIMIRKRATYLLRRGRKPLPVFVEGVVLGVGIFRLPVTKGYFPGVCAVIVIIEKDVLGTYFDGTICLGRPSFLVAVLRPRLAGAEDVLGVGTMSSVFPGTVAWLEVVAG